jgi:hypothetical protein
MKASVKRKIYFLPVLFLLGFVTLLLANGKSDPNQHPIPLEGSTLFRNMPAGDSGGSQQVFVI